MKIQTEKQKRLAISVLQDNISLIVIGIQSTLKDSGDTDQSYYFLQDLQNQLTIQEKILKNLDNTPPFRICENTGNITYEN